LLESFESGEWKSVENLEARKDELQSYATFSGENTLREGSD
jgi:hypothetical protein